ncbi:nucleotidyltransferase domain-containing protein [Planctomycetota bacterium]
MVSTKKQALAIALKTRLGLEHIYGERLRGVYLYGSAARDQLDENSDIDIAIILDQIPDRFEEHERTSKLGSDLSLQENTLVSFTFLTVTDFEKGRFSIHRSIKREGIPA